MADPKASQTDKVIIAFILKAARDGLAEANCRTVTIARATRFRAYSLIRKIKSERKDFTLVDACEAITLSIRDEWLVAQRVDKTAGILGLMDAIDKEDLNYESPQERAARESLEAVQRKLSDAPGDAAEPVKRTPYY